MEILQEHASDLHSVKREGKQDPAFHIDIIPMRTAGNDLLANLTNSTLE